MAPAARPALLAGLALVLLGAPAQADSFEFSGPLRISDQFLLTHGTLLIQPSPLELLEPGGWQVELGLSTANTFVRSESLQRALEARTERLPITPEFLERVDRERDLTDPLFFVDGESLRSELRLRKGLAGGLEIEVRLPFLELYDGWMDGFLEEFHSLGGIDQDGRFGVPKDRSLVYVQLGDRELLTDPPYSGLADPQLALRGRSRFGNKRRPVLWDVAVKVPIADEDRLASSGSLDLSGQAQVSRCRQRNCRYLALNVRYLGRWDLLGLGGRLVPGFYTGWEQRFQAVSWVVQLMVAGSPVKGIRVEDLHSNTWQLSGGLHWRWGDFEMTAAVTENVAHFENGPDLTLYLAARRGF